MSAPQIPWSDWGDEPFARARREHKPVLLAIAASWCHWCHAMDETCYADAEIARLIAEQFVPVRVDADRRPDVNERYNLGGWPTTAFLAPDGSLLGGGTYIPPERFRGVLREVGEAFASRRDTGSPAATARLQPAQPTPGPLAPGLVENASREVVASAFDREWGGFGTAPKFPQPHAIGLALERYFFTGSAEFKEIAARSLDAMGWGGLYDAVDGGFFRYSTTRDWSVPHFEKLLEDNARLLALYLDAFVVLGARRYRDRAIDVIRFVNNRLADLVDGGFYGSQAADEEYHALDRLEARRDHGAPRVDQTLYADWNGLMVAAFLSAADVLDDPSLREFAVKSLERVVLAGYRPGAGVAHYTDGRSQLRGLFSDQVQISWALIAAHRATANHVYVELAEELMLYSLRTMWDEEGKGFFDSTLDEHAIGYLRQRVKPIIENAEAAMVLHALAEVLRKSEYRDRAMEALSAFAGSYRQCDLAAAAYARAVDRVLNPPVTVAIVGGRDTEATQALCRVAGGWFHPRKQLVLLDPGRDCAEIQARGLRPVPIAAYVGEDLAWSPPHAEPEQLAALLRQTR